MLHGQLLPDVRVAHRVGETCIHLTQLNGSACRSTVIVIPDEDDDEDRIGDWDALYVSRVARHVGASAIIVGDLVGYGAATVATMAEAVILARARVG
jgi:hypothetical protein